MQNFLENKSRSKPSGGFTLIELMITIAIVGILAAIAIPNYMNHVLKANRSAAQSFMLNAAQRQQQYFLDNRSYAPDFATLQVPIPNDVSPNYTVVLNLLPGPPLGFEIIATPTGKQDRNNEPALRIDQSGAKTPNGTAYGAW